MQNPIFYNARRMRPGWRVLFFIALFLVLDAALFYLFFGPPPADAPTPDPGTPINLVELLAGKTVELIPLLAVSALFVLYLDRRPWVTLGLALHRAGRREFFLGLIVGAGLISLVFGAALGMGAVQVTGMHFDRDVSIQLGIGLATFFISALWEELALRGYLFQTLLEGLGVYPTLALTSVLFAILHVTNPHIHTLALVNIALAGLLLGVLYLRTKALWLPIGFHFGWNILQAHLFSLPLSGLTVEPVLLEVQQTQGAPMLHGGAFGLEGSLLATAALGAALWGVLWKRWPKPETNIETLWNQHLQVAKFGGELP